MSSSDAANAPAADWTQGEQDLGPLAWVLDELRKSLDGAVKAMRRFVRDAEIARESDLASLDAGALRIARQQLHQASGALEMVGMGPPALILRSMEAAVQKFVQRPELCTDDAAGVIERASFALVEYLENVLAGKAASPVALFPQYREAQALTGADRVHPADLWPVERRFREPDLLVTAAPLAYGPEARARMDNAVLRIVKNGDVAAAGDLRDLCLGFVAAQADRQSRAFWKICAGFFEAFGNGLLPADVYVKRVASRVLMQYATLAKGDSAIADRLVQDLLFFCSQARSTDAAAEQATTPALHAVRQAFGLDRFKPVDYETPRFGLYDPALLAQARKRIASATETWSALAGGDRKKLKPAVDQFSLVCDSLNKLHPGSESLAQALTHAVDATARTGEPPSAALAMEVATSVLYLQATFEELDSAHEYMAARAARLAERLDQVTAGAAPEPLEPWMEELYRRVSDHQTMGSVVDELRATLAEAEKAMDQFFRNPEDLTALAAVPGRLAQMRGVLSVLGLDQASLAVVRMRDTVERLMVHQVPEAERQQVFEKLGNSLGALGFLIDMLSYQRTMARKLFVYDEELGELRIVMGRSRTRESDEPQEIDAVLEERTVPPLPDVLPRLDNATTDDLGGIDPVSAAGALDLDFDLDLPSTVPAVAPAAAPAPAATVPNVAAATPDNEEDELLDIFLEEAREVVTNGLAAVQALRAEPGDLSEQTTLRRAFHTLKGSSRMVGLDAFGEAGWSMEQALNAWLAEQKPISEPLLQLSDDSLRAFGRWADDIAAGDAGQWHPQPFRVSADAMRADGTLVPLVTPGSAAAEPAHAQDPVALDSGLIDLPTLELDAGEPADAAQAPEPLAHVADVAEQESTDLALPEIDLLLPDDGDEQPDFAETSFSLDDERETAPADAPAGELAEEIDFAAFAEALEEADAAAQSAAAADTAGTDSAAEAAPADDAFPALDVAEFDLDLDPLPELPPEPAVQDEAVPVAQEESEPEPEPVPVEESAEPQGREEPVAEAEVTEPEAVSETAEEAAPEPEPEAETAHEPEPEPEHIDLQASDDALAAAVDAPSDEAVKVIESLRIGIPLYNVYLNEADEWSRRLVTSLQEWSLELHEPLPDTAVALAHSLAGSSSTVGFSALSEMARTLEHALQHVQLQPQGLPSQATVFMAAAEDIRRLLHQFAAGFLKEPNAQVLEQLREILQSEVDSTLPAEDAGLDDGDAAQAATAAADEPQDAVVPETVATPPVQRGYVAPALSIVAPVDEAAAQADAALAQALAMHHDIDDDIDAVDIIDPDLFPIFEEEAIELLPALGAALRQWSSHPDNTGARSELLRVLHTLKGSSRLAGAMRLGEMSHRMESAVEQIDMDTATTADIEPLLASLDGLQANFDGLRKVGAQPLTEPVVVPAAAVAAAQAAEAADGKTAAAVPVAKAALRAPVSTPLAPARAAAGHSVRVRAQLLDRLVNQAGEVMIARSRLDSRIGQMRSSLSDLSGNLDRLRQQLRDIEVQAESQMQSRLALSKDSAAGFDPLEFDRFTRVQELTRMMAESVNDVATVQRNLQRTMEGAEDDLIAQGRQARELQRDLLRTRMVEFEGISERLYAVVRQSSKEMGKQIKLDITGGSIEMDRGVLDRMTPAFEHLLRNCVAHGIEEPQTRTAAGKPAVGTITVDVRQAGNDVSVEFRDDGAGLDVDRIRAKAVAQGLVAADADLSNADAANLIFMPGFSTASEVTGLSGRGIGMDVVRSEVNALGGRIETSTESGKGAAFRMVLPLTTAVTQVVMLRSGGQSIGVPANLIEIVRRTTLSELEEAYRTGVFEDGVESLPFFWSGALLQSSSRSTEPASKTRPVVILRSASQRMAMHVDEVLGNQEVVVKNLGPQLSRLPGLAGMSVLASGAVVLIYNPVALATVYGEQVRAVAAAAPLAAGGGAAVSAAAGAAVPSLSLQAAVSQVPLVLVVDDSITVRRVTQRLLQREGYRVALAADGLQALERLQDERPTVVLSDIEMPRMDGFDLARNIRADAALRELPIIMITSRIAEKHREHAMELGVNHYLGKPYSDEELLSLVQHYAELAAQAAQAATA
ncbi:MAG: response regulator [Comamonadaceae bacterium]|nr:MAG: response regulator [Comamonadaceae bacterium]